MCHKEELINSLSCHFDSLATIKTPTSHICNPETIPMFTFVSGIPVHSTSRCYGTAASFFRHPSVWHTNRFTSASTRCCVRPSRIDELAAAQTQHPIIPWASPSVPVYTISTYNKDLQRGNFNIATYLTPCALKPPQKYVIALYVDTLTWKTVKATSRLRLSIMSERHKNLLELFGKTSGYQVDKVLEAKTRGFSLGETGDNVPYLVDSAGYVDLIVDQWTPCGDHDLAFCSVVSTRILADADPVLTTGALRDAGLL